MKTKLKPGYVSILAVVTLSAVLLLMLTASFRFSIQNQETQKKNQIRIDYTSREQALLRGVLTETGNRAMQAMMQDSAGDWTLKNRWRWIFEYARDKADGETALDSTVASTLGINGQSISANTGDGAQDHIAFSVKPVKEESSLNLFYLNAGINATGDLLGDGYPEPLVFPGGLSVEKLDRDVPIISTEKTYASGALYKSIPYPDIHFGYATQGQNFVAKRNWWAFSLEYGAQSEGATGVKTKKKNFVLSLYEVPSQLGLGSTANTLLGKHEDGSAWANITIDGGVFGSRVETEGALSLDRLASRKGITLSGSSSVGQVAHDDFSGDLPTREQYEADNADFFPISSSADSGLVAFLPITRGEDAFDDLSNTTDPNRASPTSWNWYSRPAMQAVMKLRVEDVVSFDNQTPTAISFTYLESGLERTLTYEQGSTWPIEFTPEGEAFPFHLETTHLGRPALAVHVERMTSYLASIGADSPAVNHSLVVNANYRDNVNISKPNIPSLEADISLILRDTNDLTAFANGFSLVTPFRMYLANDVNIVSTGTDTNGNALYPPLSLFAPEKRFGVREEAVNIEFEGQLNFVGKEDSNAVRPLDFKSGVADEIVGGKIQANLRSISSASQLPPINQMNWLIVIEEVD